MTPHGTQIPTEDIPAYANVYDSDRRQWQTDALSDLDAEDWAEWIDTRIRGEDRWLPYARGEKPDHTARIFRTVAGFCERHGVDLAPAREGAAAILEGIDPAGENPNVTKNAMYAARFFTIPEADDSAETVADWIRSGSLLDTCENEEEGPYLLRMALFSLAELQKRHAGQYQDIWQQHFEKKEDLDNPYFYISAAFVGLVFGCKTVPAGELWKLLQLLYEAEEEGQFLPVEKCVEAFWRQWRCDKNETIREFNQHGTAKEKWKLLEEVSPACQVIRGWESEVRGCAPTGGSIVLSASLWGTDYERHPESFPRQADPEAETPLFDSETQVRLEVAA